jgi:LmbE family N-acetylglucosaminyl deacetylase
VTTTQGRVLFVAAHPDDADFLAGGTIARLVKEGRETAYVIVTNGNKGASDRGIAPADLIALREASPSTSFRHERTPAAALDGVLTRGELLLQ